MRRVFTIYLFLWAFMTLLASTASAAIDPARANADAAEVLSAQRGFCINPGKPLSEAALGVCPYAAEIPDCQPLVDACDSALHPKTTTWPWLTKALNAIGHFLALLFNRLGAIGLWILAGVVLILILYPILSSVAASRRMPGENESAPLSTLKMKTDADPAVLSREDDPVRMLEEANALASRKEYDRALYRYLHAALLALDKRGNVRIAKGTTHGEYVRSCTDDEARPPLRDLVREIDMVRFGGRTPSEGGVSVAQEKATWIVRHAGIALAALVLLIAGCGDGPSRMNDPSGSDVLMGMLTKEGASIERMPSSIARLKLPTAQTRITTPALFIDVDRVPLSDETQGHLVTWVEAGGTLVMVGSPEHWPAELKAKSEKTTSTTIEVKTYPDVDEAENENETDDHGSKEPEARVDHGKLAHPAAVTWIDPRTFVIATTSDDKDYAVGQMRGSGSIYAVASDDLFTNAGLSIPGNAAAAIAILASVPRTRFWFASPIDGFSPPSNPFKGLLNAGLGLPLGHAFFAVVILFFAVGMRFGRARPEPPPTRRAFAEHVAATAAVYNRAGAAKHALASFSRFAENRLVKRLGRGAPDIVTLLSQRSGDRIEDCAHVWARALAAREFEYEKPNGDEIVILRRLTLLYAKTIRSI